MLLLAWPLVLTNVAQQLINATDVVLLGWAGASTLAAAALGMNLYVGFLVLSIGLVQASAPIMAKAIGARASNIRDVRSTVRQTMWAVFVLVVPLWMVLWFSGSILRAIGQDPALAADAQRFVRIMQWGLLPALLYNVLRAFVAAVERPFWSLVVVGVTIVVNAFLNYGLIFGEFGFPELGLAGAAIAHLCASCFLFLGMAAVVVLHPRFRRYHLFGDFLRADWPRFRRIWVLGLPIAVTLAFEAGIFNAALFLMGLIGPSSIAAHAVTMQIASLAFMVPLGLAQAATVRVGLAFGRRDPDGIARAGWTAFALGTGFMVATALVMLGAPLQLIGLFLEGDDPANRDVIRLARGFLFVAALFQIVDGAQVVGAGMLRGLHDTRIPMLIAGFGYWIVGMLIAIVLGFGLGWEGLGIWIGLAAGLAVVAVLMMMRWIRRDRLPAWRREMEG